MAIPIRSAEPAAAEIRLRVEQNLALVEPIARAVWRRLPRGYIELADVMQAGMLGLIDAARRYDAAAGRSPFEFYARQRIRGAIIDSIRCEPFYGWVRNRREFPPDLAAAGEDEDDLPGRRQVRLHQALTRAIASLTERERKILELVYVEGRSMRDIGETRMLAANQRRVQELHRRAIDKLRTALRKAA